MKSLLPRHKYSLALPIVVCAVLLLPWLGECLFYSKGEPREAIVAMTMLDQGNWVLPVSHGCDIPYKPPLLAWLIAAFSWLFNGGVVNEYMSRLPSALAAVAMLCATWRFFALRVGERRAWLVMLVTLTSFEVYRAAMACRVDMVLTACMVCGTYGLVTMQGRPRRVIATILLLSGATLTKGPVGTLLPCLAVGLYMLRMRRGWWRTVLTLAGTALASLVLPALWYWLAYRQGGDHFGALAWEENIGRLTGSMGYESHVNPWYYNIVSLASGLLPWTVPVLLALVVKPVRQWMRTSLKALAPTGRLCITVALTVLVFYSIPASKRSVYILPCYPFVAYGVALLLDSAGNARILRVWTRLLAVLAVIAVTVCVALQFVTVGNLEVEAWSWWQWPVAVLPLLGGLWWLLTRTRRSSAVGGMCGLTLLLYLAYGAVFAPAFVNPRSDKAAAQQVSRMAGDRPVVTYIPQDSLLRFYSINFYMHDRLRRVTSPDSVPAGSVLLSSVAADTGAIMIKERSCDTRRPVYLSLR